MLEVQTERKVILGGLSALQCDISWIAGVIIIFVEEAWADFVFWKSCSVPMPIITLTHNALYNREILKVSRMYICINKVAKHVYNSGLPWCLSSF